MFVPVGMWSLTAFRQRGTTRRPLGGALWIGFLVAAGIELTQVFVENRHCSSTDVIVAMIGISAGAVGMEWFYSSQKVEETSSLHSGWYESVVFWLWLSLGYFVFLVCLFSFPKIILASDIKIVATSPAKPIRQRTGRTPVNTFSRNWQRT